jgi:hypothetical protein
LPSATSLGPDPKTAQHPCPVAQSPSSELWIPTDTTTGFVPQATTALPETLLALGRLGDAGQLQLDPETTSATLARSDNSTGAATNAATPEPQTYNNITSRINRRPSTC